MTKGRTLNPDFRVIASMNSVIKRNESSGGYSNIEKKRRWQMKNILYKVGIPLGLAVVLIFSLVFYSIGSAVASPSFTSKCTLNILCGSVSVTLSGFDDARLGIDGMTLDIGDTVSTAPDSAALLTFFDGSTLTLDTDTAVQIEQLKPGDSDQSITVILKQMTGSTWSHVVKLADRSYHYEIKTPSAVALVRGTQFLTEVDLSGTTEVLTAEGLVSVCAQGEEIFLPAGQKTNIVTGLTPSEPITVDVSGYLSAEDNLLKGILSEVEHSKDSSNNIKYNNAVKFSNTENTISQVVEHSQNDNGKSLNIEFGAENGITAIGDDQDNAGNGQDNSQGNANANGNGQDNSQGNASSNGNGQDNGQGNANANGNGQDNSQGNANSNSNSQDNGQGNASSNGNGQDNGQGNANSNSNSQDNGQGNANSNSNSNSQDNGNGNDNGNNGSQDSIQDKDDSGPPGSQHDKQDK